MNSLCYSLRLRTGKNAGFLGQFFRSGIGRRWGIGTIEQFLRGCTGQCQTLFSERSHVTKRRRPRGLFRKSWSDSSWPSFGSLVSCQNFEHIISDRQCFRHRARTQSGHGPNPPPFGRLRRDRPPPSNPHCWRGDRIGAPARHPSSLPTSPWATLTRRPGGRCVFFQALAN